MCVLLWSNGERAPDGSGHSGIASQKYRRGSCEKREKWEALPAWLRRRQWTVGLTCCEDGPANGRRRECGYLGKGETLRAWFAVGGRGIRPDGRTDLRLGAMPGRLDDVGDRVQECCLLTKQQEEHNQERACAASQGHRGIMARDQSACFIPQYLP